MADARSTRRALSSPSNKPTNRGGQKEENVRSSRTTQPTARCSSVLITLRSAAKGRKGHLKFAATKTPSPSKERRTKVHVDNNLLRFTAAGSNPGVPYVSGAMNQNPPTSATPMRAAATTARPETTSLVNGRRRVVRPTIETG